MPTAWDLSIKCTLNGDVVVLITKDITITVILLLMFAMFHGITAMQLLTLPAP
jgi:hypothetical protein